MDYDRDGLYDLYFATGSKFPLDRKNTLSSNELYRNLGEWQFRDVTDQAGVGHLGYSAGIAVGDYDSDGFPDVYVTCFGENQLFWNRGDGTFERLCIVEGGSFSTSAAFFDPDGDGLLDLYVCNYGKWSYEENPFCGDQSRHVRIFCSPKSLEPEPDRLLQNRGDGTFCDVTSLSHLDAEIGRAQGVLASDIDGDGRIDLYIGNDIHPNFLFLNTGDGRFSNATELSGAAYDRNGQMQAGMGVVGADVNRDGRWDLFVTNFEGEHNTLYFQSAPGEFYDVSASQGVAGASNPWVGWGAAFADFNLDGWKDLIVTNGHVDDNLKELGRDSPYEHPALVWKNEKGRLEFLGESESAGSYFQRPHPGRGLATVDLDDDGDLDIVITHQDQHPALLRNDCSARRESLTCRLIGRQSNRDAVGSRITVTSTVAPRVEQIQGGGSYLSAHDPRVTLAVEGNGPVEFEIDWASGMRSTVTGLSPFQCYIIVEPAAADSPPGVFSYPWTPVRKADHE